MPDKHLQSNLRQVHLLCKKAPLSLAVEVGVKFHYEM